MCWGRRDATHHRPSAGYLAPLGATELLAVLSKYHGEEHQYDHDYDVLISLRGSSKFCCASLFAKLASMKLARIAPGDVVLSIQKEIPVLRNIPESPRGEAHGGPCFQE
jgi:hypothetical protein